MLNCKGSRSLIVIAAALLFAACGSPPSENKRPPAPSPTPLQPDAIRVEKPINISFSTYSKDWPVGWLWIDPDEKYAPTPPDVKTGVLRIKIPPKKNLSAENRNAPRYVKPITGDFEIETRLKFYPTENYQGAGLLIYDGETKYMVFLRAYGGVGGGASGLRIDVQTPDGYTPIVTPNDIPSEAQEVSLKVVRSGNLFSSFWREDEKAEWRAAGEFRSDYPETILAGLVACNMARETVAEFGYIHLLPAKGQKRVP